MLILLGLLFFFQNINLLTQTQNIDGLFIIYFIINCQYF